MENDDYYNRMVEAAHHRMDKIERHIKHRYQAPTVPQYDLQGGPPPNFVTFTLNSAGDTITTEFGQADSFHNYALFTPEWDAPYISSGGSISLPSSPDASFDSGLDWTTITTGDQTYEATDITGPVSDAPFMVILCKDSGGQYFPIGSGYMRVGSTSEITPLMDVTYHYDGTNVFSFDIAGTNTHQFFRPITLNLGGTFGSDGAPFHQGNGGTLTINWTRSGSTPASCWVGIVCESDDLTHAFADMNGFFSIDGCIVENGVPYDGPPITRDFNFL